MKSLIICALFASAALLHGARSQEDDLPYGDKLMLYGPFGPFRSTSDLNGTNVCSSGGVYDRPVLQTTDSGWAYNVIGCRVPDNTFLNVSGGVMAVMYSHIPIVPIGFNFRATAVGAGAALVVDGPMADYGRMYVPWMVEVVGNIFGKNAQLRILGSLPVNSTVVIEGNKFDVDAPSAHLSDTLQRVMAISFGGRLSEFFEPSVLYFNSRIMVQNNDIVVDGAAKGLRGTGIAQLSDMYFTTGTSMDVKGNVVTASCAVAAECSGFDATDAYIDFSSWEYERGSYAVDGNTFNIANGRGLATPHLWAPNATFLFSASHNNITISNGEDPTKLLSEHSISIGQHSMGQSATVRVEHNRIESKRGNTLIFFQSALALEALALISVSHNHLTTTGGDPSVYVIDQMSLADKSALNIDGNIFIRTDDAAVTRPYLSLTYDFSVLGFSELSFRNNEMVPTNTRAGPLMVILTDGKIANVGPTAYFAICNNNYNGNPADLMTSTVLRPNVQRLINCNPRPEYTRFPQDTTTTAPSTTPKATTRPPTQPTEATAATTLATAKPTTTTKADYSNAAPSRASVLCGAASAFAIAMLALVA